MLVLARKVDESIHIDVPPNAGTVRIVVKLLRVQSHQVAKLGFEAPKDVAIVRSELTRFDETK